MAQANGSHKHHSLRYDTHDEYFMVRKTVTDCFQSGKCD
ncbi:Uncharacterised protein [Vibrio cholerae]|nr:Uncharacterised protein [Vibrio cholerae]